MRVKQVKKPSIKAASAKRKVKKMKIERDKKLEILSKYVAALASNPGAMFVNSKVLVEEALKLTELTLQAIEDKKPQQTENQ